MGKPDNMMITNFWEILESFPQIKNLSDLTKVIVNMEETEDRIKYPNAYKLLTEFEASIRSHIYTEWHAQEFYHDVDSAYAA